MAKFRCINALGVPLTRDKVYDAGPVCVQGTDWMEVLVNDHGKTHQRYFPSRFEPYAEPASIPLADVACAFAQYVRELGPGRPRETLLNIAYFIHPDPESPAGAAFMRACGFGRPQRTAIVDPSMT